MRQSLVGLFLLFLTGCGETVPQGVIGHVKGFAGIVISDEPKAATIARDILSSGGNAADAAVALYFAQAVTYPSRAGIAAGGICMAYSNKDKKIEVVNFANVSGLPLGPRAMAGLHSKYGSSRWEALLSPAEGLARFGNPVSRALAQDLLKLPETDFNDVDTRKFFYPKGPLKEGEKLLQPDLAAFISRLRANGVGDLYAGKLAGQIIPMFKSLKIEIDPEKFKLMAPVWEEPISAKVGNETLYFPTTPIGKQMQGLWKKLTEEGKIYAKAPKEDRPFVVLDVLIKEKALPIADGGNGFLVLDKDGSGVACGLSMGSLFGRGFFLPGLGIILPDPVPDVPPPVISVNKHTNEIHYLAAGGGAEMGFAAILDNMLLVNILEVSPSDAASNPRLMPGDGMVIYEEGESKSIIDGIKKRKLTPMTQPNAGRVNSINCKDGLPSNPNSCLFATDPRGFGLGFRVGDKK